MRVRKSVGSALVVVFEGRDCPGFYLGKLANSLGSIRYAQVIARGKQNVLAFRDLVRRNIDTKDDDVLYFVDRDYDEEPAPGTFLDVYVTRGYSIENEAVSWDFVESVLRAYFDIAQADDDAALLALRETFRHLWVEYVSAAYSLHATVFVCRRNKIQCYPGDTTKPYVFVDVKACVVRPKCKNDDDLMNELQVDQNHRQTVKQLAAADAEFCTRDASTEWRGKYHFHFLREFLAQVRDARTCGTSPFTRKANVPFDPMHPTSAALLLSSTPTPRCLSDFFAAYKQRRSNAFVATA